ncbi:MAG TPA: hypothetical protein VJU81_05685 [Methylomirabilota bacterium]|nr:hypothetical protein [Methylomirabilota bacterium]
MTRLFLVTDAAEIARRRRQAPAGRIVEAWPDIDGRGEWWVGEESKALLDAAGGALPARITADGTRVPIYYGPRLRDVESLPTEESLRGRILSAHGIGAAWVTLDAAGERNTYEPTSPADPVFFLRRPGGNSAHVWRLFRRRAEAETYMREYYGRDEEAAAWARALPAADWDDYLARYCVRI